MILKKPYAFLIKYYRLIHIALAALLSAGVYKLSSVYSFFNTYVKSGYTTTVVTDLDKLYTPASAYLVVFLMLVLSSAILILLIHKKKPAKLYMAIIAYYLFIFFGLFYISSILKSFEIELLASTTARSLRDILLIISLPQYLFIALILLRTIGFNVKKFDFADERKNFGESDQDNEEFEIKIDFKGYKVKQKTNRALREGIYYVKENRLIVLCILVVLGIFGLYTLYNNISGDYDQNYKIGNSFVYNKLNVTIEDAIITNLDYNGKVIEESSYYLVLKVRLINNSGGTVQLDYNNFKLMIGSSIINPTVKDSKYFVDFAAGYAPNSLSPKADRVFALAYKINKKDIKKDMKLRIHNGTIYENEEYIDKHIFVALKNDILPDVAIANNYKTTQKISFDDTFLNNTSLVINEYLVTKKYVYHYEVCNRDGECSEYTDAITVPLVNNRHNNRLVVLSVDYKQDEFSSYTANGTSLYGFANNFVKIQYRVNNEVYSDNSKNVTPTTSTNLMIFEVPAEIENADIIQAIVTVRNKKYIINLKVE